MRDDSDNRRLKSLVSDTTCDKRSMSRLSKLSMDRLNTSYKSALTRPLASTSAATCATLSVKTRSNCVIACWVDSKRLSVVLAICAMSVLTLDWSSAEALCGSPTRFPSCSLSAFSSFSVISASICLMVRFHSACCSSRLASRSLKALLKPFASSISKPNRERFTSFCSSSCEASSLLVLDLISAISFSRSSATERFTIMFCSARLRVTSSARCSDSCPSKFSKACCNVLS
mmetsp:Transcript_29647/g.78560  ORF Transcript_29647/g.78560 Transcript_29647/m.78560 type:complete len:231 (+) Transcript_29647:1315-2007(+)